MTRLYEQQEETRSIFHNIFRSFDSDRAAILFEEMLTAKSKMKTIALYSIKGGVGKTAAAVNLSYLSALNAPPCLICDLDPQGASSYYFRITASKKYDSDKFLKGNKKIHRNIKATDFENLDLLPSDFSYRNLDIELSEEKKPQKKLKKNLESLSDDYSHVFFDCPPNLTLLSESVFSASDIILVPMIPTTLSIRTYNQLIDFFTANNLDRSKIRAFFTMVEKRKPCIGKSLPNTALRQDFSAKQSPTIQK